MRTSSFASSGWSYCSSIPAPKGEQVLYEQGLAQLHDAIDARRSRLLEVREGIPNLLWVVLVLGGVITRPSPTYSGLRATWRMHLWSLLEVTDLRHTLHHRRVRQPVLRGRGDPADASKEMLGSFGGIWQTCSYVRSWLWTSENSLRKFAVILPHALR